MNQYHVVMPVEKLITISDRFDAILHLFNKQHAVVHLVAINQYSQTLFHHSAALQRQQTQMARMASYLKFEMLDHIAQAMQEKAKNISFKYHVEFHSFAEGISALQTEYSLRMVVVDQNTIVDRQENALGSVLEACLARTGLPLWLVGQNGKSVGGVLTAIDLPIHNHQQDQFNRQLIQTAVNIAAFKAIDVHISHSWQLKSEEFMRQWLQLTDIDIARFARSEKEQREIRIYEYLGEIHHHESPMHVQVVEGTPEITLPYLCEHKDISLLVLGHHNSSQSLGLVAVDLLASIECDALVMPQGSFDVGLMTQSSLTQPKLIRQEAL